MLDGKHGKLGERKNRGQRWGQENGGIEIIRTQKGNPKWRAQREESPGSIQEIRAKAHCTQTQVPRAIVRREARERPQDTSILSLVVNHGRTLKGLDQSGEEIRGYFKKMNGGEGRKWQEERECEAGRLWVASSMKEERANQASSWILTTPFPFDLATSYFDLNFEMALQVKLATFFTCH